jgi:ADP-dependent NAD(P)H-hydrate dehydratase / NAD(P)H-hydrate epimerase
VRIVTAQEVQAVEREAKLRFGLGSLALMERAGESLAAWSRLFLPSDRRARVVVLAGGGRNGGDGLVCARHLVQAGVDVTVLLLTGRSLAPETRRNLQRLRRTTATLSTSSVQMPAGWVRAFLAADLVVDALLGIGLSGPVRDPAAGVIQALNSTGVKVLAADVPSGLDADRGDPSHPTVRADLTLSFIFPKRGLLQPQAGDFVGRLEVDTLGLPPELLTGRHEPSAFLDAHDAGGLLPRRPMTAHKRTAGRVLVIGGSDRYHGAPLLAAAGAVRSGAGFVTLAYPRSLDAVVRHHALEELCLPLPAAAGKLGARALAPLLAAAREADAVVLGPGLGRAPETRRLVKEFVKRAAGPRVIVLDADALDAVAGLHLGNGRHARPVLVLTPHEGEAARLLGTTSEAVAQDRWGAARELAQRYGAVALLKGRHTVVVGPHGPLSVIGAGTAALATAGTGDVLAGAVAAFCAQKVVPRDAAALAAYLHGLAGDLASPDPGGLGVRARDVADNLPLAIRQLRLRCRRAGVGA